VSCTPKPLDVLNGLCELYSKTISGFMHGA